MNKKAFASICFAIFVAMLGMGIISPLLSVYATSMGATGFQIGFMASGYSLSRALVQPFTGSFSDRRGRKNLMVVGLAAYAVLSIGYALANNIHQLTTVRLLHGFASALVMPIAQAYVGDICPKGKEDTYMGLFMMSMYLGMGAGPLLGGSVSEAFGKMSPAFYIMAILAACGLVLMVLFVPQTEAHIRNRKGGAPMSVMIKDNKVRAVALYLGSRGILRQGITNFIVLFGTKALHMHLTLASAVATVYILTEAFGQGLVGPITAHFSRKPLMVFGAVTASGLAFFIAKMGNFFTLLAVLIPLAIMTSIGRVPALAFNVELGVKYRRMGAGMGIANGAQDLGHFFGPIAFGWAMDHFGIGSVFTVGGIICLASVPLMTYWLYQKDTIYVPEAETATPEPAQTQR